MLINIIRSFIHNLIHIKNDFFIDNADTAQNIEDPFSISMKSEILKIGLSLALLISFLMLCVWLFKKFTSSRTNAFNNASAIKIVEKRGISPKASIYLIQINNQLLAVSEDSTGSLRFLSEIEKAHSSDKLEVKENNKLRNSMLDTIRKITTNKK